MYQDKPLTAARIAWKGQNVNDEINLPDDNFRGIDVTSLDPLLRKVIAQIHCDFYALMIKTIEHEERLEAIETVLDGVSDSFGAFAAFRRGELNDDATSETASSDDAA